MAELELEGTDNDGDMMTNERNWLYGSLSLSYGTGCFVPNTAKQHWFPSKNSSLSSNSLLPWLNRLCFLTERSATAGIFAFSFWNGLWCVEDDVLSPNDSLVLWIVYILIGLTTSCGFNSCIEEGWICWVTSRNRVLSSKYLNNRWTNRNEWRTWYWVDVVSRILVRTVSCHSK